MIKAQTVAQFKLLRHIEANFMPGAVEVTLIDRNVVRIEDHAGEAGYLIYDEPNGDVRLEEDPCT